MRKIADPNQISRGEFAVAAMALVVLCYFAHFLHWKSFGVYEDDFHFVPAIGQDWSQFAKDVQWNFTVWPQGRPLGWSIEASLPFFTYRLLGFHYLWIPTFVIVSLSTIVCYVVLRDRMPARFALTAAVFFCAYPPDACQLFISDIHIRVSMLVFLCGSLAYRANRMLWCYFLAGCVFLSYETVYVLFFGLPVFYSSGRGAFWRKLARHSLALISIVVVAIAVRAYKGEGRVGELSGHVVETIGRIAASLVIGPMTATKASILSPVSMLFRMNQELVALGLGSAFVFGAACAFLRNPIQEEGTDQVTLKNRVIQIRGVVEIRRPLLDIAAVCGLGALFLILGYGLVFRDPYFPPTILEGRLTIEHSAGAFGGAMLAGGLLWLLSFLADAYGIGKLAFVAVCALVGLTMAFRDTVQQGFAQAWQIERTFWSEVVKECPDLRDGTLIIHEQKDNYVSAALANSWADAIILPHLMAFPPTWERVPRVFSLPPSWRDGVRKNGASLEWFVPTGDWAAHWDKLDPSKLIVLEQTGPGLVRRLSRTIRLAGEDYTLSQPGAATPLARKSLFTYLIR
jgi:hypothetical protein